MSPSRLSGGPGGAEYSKLGLLAAKMRSRVQRPSARRNPLDGRAALTLAICSAVALLLLLAFGPGAVDERDSIASLEAGRVADRDVIADREISYVDENATRLRVEAEQRLVLPVFVVDEKPASGAIGRLGDFRDLIEELSAKQVAADTLFLQIQSAFPGFLQKDQVIALARSPLRTQALAYSDAILRRLLDQGVAAIPASGLEAFNTDYVELHSLGEGKSLVSEVPIDRLVTLKSLQAAVDAEAVDRRLPRPVAALASGVVASFAVEDAFFDQEQSARKLAQARTSVEPVMRTIAKGERIIRKGAIVSPLDEAKLAAARGVVSRMDWGTAAGAIGFFLFSICLGAFLLGRSVAEANLRSTTMPIVCLSAFLYFLVALFLGRFASPKPLELAFFLPTALFAIIATILEGQRFAVLYCIVLASLAQSAFGLDGRLFAFCAFSGVAAAFSVRTAVSRIDLVRAGAVLSAIEAALGAALAAPGAGGAGEVFVAALWGACNGFTCALLALAILPVLEQALNAPTRFRLMELSDLNAPILKRLLTVAPGTYSHSITVAHLAESACREIGADPLLARVGAYYHDIGKIEQPEYFVENQAGYNKHDEINPRLSATVIRSHVKLGIEKVRALGLPEAVVDIVSQHHGNAVIAWFFDQARRLGGDIDPDDFSYPGQPPSTREAAVVMLADSVEAATRTLKRPTAARLDDFIREIIMDKVRDGQLARSDLTFRDLDTIRDSFTRILAGHFHSRIEYPKLKEQPR